MATRIKDKHIPVTLPSGKVVLIVDEKKERLRKAVNRRFPKPNTVKPARNSQIF